MRRDLLEADERISGEQFGCGVEESPGVAPSVSADGLIYEFAQPCKV